MEHIKLSNLSFLSPIFASWVKQKDMHIAYTLHKPRAGEGSVTHAPSFTVSVEHAMWSEELSLSEFFMAS